jgi:hypothetical protein
LPNPLTQNLAHITPVLSSEQAFPQAIPRNKAARADFRGAHKRGDDLPPYGAPSKGTADRQVKSQRQADQQQARACGPGAARDNEAITALAVQVQTLSSLVVALRADHHREMAALRGELTELADRVTILDGAGT